MLWMLPTWVVGALVIVGLLGASTGLLAPYLGFRLFLGGTALAGISALGMAGAAAVAATSGKPWRGKALRAAAIPLMVTVAVLGTRMLSSVPNFPYNDVTTDLEEPPAFVASAAAGAVYPEEFASAQRAIYPELGPLESVLLPTEAFQLAVATAEAMPGWEVTRKDAVTGTIEAEATSPLFHFVDDVAIRIRPEGTGSRIDLRSRSRVGRSDLGANAARIEAFQRSFESGVATR